MRRSFGLVLLLGTAAILQATLFPRLPVFGVTPDLVLVMVVSIALLQGSMAGCITGFTGGMLADLLLVAPKGLSALVYLLVGYGAGSIRLIGQPAGIIAPMVGVFASSVAASACYAVLMALLGRSLAGPGHLALGALGVGLYNAALTPLVHPLVRRLSDLSRPEAVVSR